MKVIAGLRISTLRLGAGKSTRLVPHAFVVVGLIIGAAQAQQNAPTPNFKIDFGSCRPADGGLQTCDAFLELSEQQAELLRRDNVPTANTQRCRKVFGGVSCMQIAPVTLSVDTLRAIEKLYQPNSSKN